MTGLRDSARRPDAGFTLIELLVAVAILGIITVPLANFVIGYLLNTSTTVGRLSESHDEQIAAAYFAQDVANVGTRGPDDALTQSVWPGAFPAGGCGAGVDAANQILLLTWDEVSWNGTAEVVASESAAYVVKAAAGETQLHRLYCRAGNQLSDVVIAHNLDPSVTPQVSCSGTCTAAPGVPTTITLTVRIASSTASGQPFSMSLTGERRQS